IGKIFDIPVVIITSAQTAFNGPILDMYPNAPVVKRNGEIDTWDNEELRDAIRATGRKQSLWTNQTAYSLSATLICFL
ncbi:hypothetical protein BJ742DRAFT_685137, partial [Cladochytrium replicatum]